MFVFHVVVIVVTIAIVIFVVVVVIIVGPRNLTLKYGQNQINNTCCKRCKRSDFLST